MLKENSSTVYEWETSTPVLRCAHPECRGTVNAMSGGRTFECYGCGDRWRAGSKKHTAAVERTKREGNP